MVITKLAACTETWNFLRNIITLPETKSSHLKIGRNPKGRETSIPTIHFQVRAASFREGNLALNKVVSLNVLTCVLFFFHPPKKTGKVFKHRPSKTTVCVIVYG